MKVIDNPVAPRYTTVERLDIPNFICMRIEDGEFEGVVYHYENLKISEKLEDSDDPWLRFNYHIVESFWADGMFEGKLKESFEDTVACILQDILIKQVGRIGDEDRADDSKESGSQRGLRP
jgi:hypothetical protein